MNKLTAFHIAMAASPQSYPITIRPVRASDAEDLHTIALCPNVRMNTLNLPYQTIARTKQNLERLPPHDVKLVAVNEQSKVIATLGIHANNSPARRHAAWIGMMVHDDFQGRGIGTRLLQEGVDIADRWLAIRRLELEVYCENERAVNLYKKFGFAKEGRLVDYAFRDGRFVDAFMMARVNK